MTPASPNYAGVIRLALPIVVSNLSTPLLGLVDTAIMGRLPGPHYLGGVALGALIFTVIFWAFGSLRMGTTGLTAQAEGAGSTAGVSAQLGRGLVLAAALGLGLVLLQKPIGQLAHWLLQAPPAVAEQAQRYYAVRIFSAPAALANYALLGWFLGLARTRVALILQLVINLLNLGLDTLFVLGLGMEAEGVAWGTALAEGAGALCGLYLARQVLRERGASIAWQRVRNWPALRQTLAVNANISVRTLCLVSVFAFFQAQSARFGVVLLAANAVLMQLVSFSAYFLDGIAFAAEALVGRAIGARDAAALRSNIERSTHVAVALAGTLSLLLYAATGPLIDALTVSPAVRAAARTYAVWAALAPLAGVLSFQLDGIFIGATLSAEMRNAMLATLGLFLASWWLLRGFANHGLWGALYSHYLARTLLLWWQRGRVFKLSQAPPAEPA